MTVPHGKAEGATKTVVLVDDDAMILEAMIENTYYHYSQPDQVTAPGVRGSVESYIQETPYRAVAYRR